MGIFVDPPLVNRQAYRRDRQERAPQATPAHVRRVASLADIPQMTSNLVEIVPLSHRQGKCTPFAAIRGPDFGD